MKMCSALTGGKTTKLINGIIELTKCNDRIATRGVYFLIYAI